MFLLDVLVETIYWSVDPYMRVQMPKLPINSTMIGENIARLEHFLLVHYDRK